MSSQQAAEQALSVIERRLADPAIDADEKAVLRAIYPSLAAAVASADEQIAPEMETAAKNVVASLAEVDRNQRLSLLNDAAGVLAPPPTGAVSTASPTAAPAGTLPKSKTVTAASAEVVPNGAQPVPDSGPLADRSFSSAILVILVCAATFPFLMILLCSPLVQTDGLLEPVFVVTLVKALATNPGTYSGTLQVMIIPAAAALSATSFPWLFQTRAAAWLVVIAFVGMFSALLDGLIYGTASDFDSATKGVVSQYFVMSAGSIFTYIMLLIGLRIAATRQLDNVRH